MSEEGEDFCPAWQANNPVIHQPPETAIRIDEGEEDDDFWLHQDGDCIKIRDLDALIALQVAIQEKIEEVEDRD